MAMSTAEAVTQMLPNATTHLYDTWEDIFIHPHWRQFPLVPDAWHYAIGVFITFVGLTGVFGNLLVIYIFGTTKTLRSPSNMFVVNLALSDLTFSAVNGFPLLTFSAFNKRWIFGQVACQFYGLIGGIFGLMSINTMALIAMDRYNVIARSVSASHNMTHRKAFLAIVFVWLWSVGVAIPPIFGWGAYIPEGFQTSCTFDYLTRGNWARSYILFLYILGFVCPLIIIIFAYFHIVKAVATHEAEMKAMAKRLQAESIRSGQEGKTSSEIKTAKISMTIIMAYLCSWTPYATIALIAQFGPAYLVTPYVSEIPVMFAKASAMHNPIIYALSHPRFREALNQKFPWLLCCCGFKEKEVAKYEDKKDSKMSSKDYTSEMSSCVSNLDDNIEMSHPRGQGGKGRGQGSTAETNMSADNNGLVRDILQAFVGVVNAQQRSAPVQPVYLPPQYMPYAMPQPADGRTDVYSIPQGAAPPVTVAADGRVGVPGVAPTPAAAPAPPGTDTPRPKHVAAKPDHPPAPANATIPEQTTVEISPGQENKAFEKE